ncbi:MAG: hypothetical protein R2719_15350 [Micropruina sp.]
MLDGDDARTLLAEGDSWKDIQALSWQAGDILVVGSSSTRTRCRAVFLGFQRVQDRPVVTMPVVVVP